jgi:polysaccharide biosynthesis protein PelC
LDYHFEKTNYLFKFFINKLGYLYESATLILIMKYTAYKNFNCTLKTVSGLVLLFILTACSVSQVHEGPALSTKVRWIMLPVMNLAEAPQAGIRTEAILSTHLRAMGLTGLDVYPYQSLKTGLPDLNEQHRYESALKSAKKSNYQYAITGSVEEWRYKSGLDGEPAVGMSLKVIDMKTGKIIWSASGSRTGWGYESVTGTVNKLLSQLLDDLDLE